MSSVEDELKAVCDALIDINATLEDIADTLLEIAVDRGIMSHESADEDPRTAREIRLDNAIERGEAEYQEAKVREYERQERENAGARGEANARAKDDG